jgi:hypothetical protein
MGDPLPAHPTSASPNDRAMTTRAGFPGETMRIRSAPRRASVPPGSAGSTPQRAWPPVRRVWALVLPALLSATMVPSPAQAQASSAGGAGSVYVPADHWLIEALTRLDAFPELGVAVPWGHGPATREQILRLLHPSGGGDPAVSLDASGVPSATAVVSPALQHLLQAYRARFLEEIGGREGTSPGGWIRWAGGSLDLRVSGGSDVLGTGAGGTRESSPIPPRTLGRPSLLGGSVAGALELGPVGVGGGIRPNEAGRLRISELYAAGTAGPLQLWAGRRAPRFGVANGGTVVLSGRVPIDGGGLALARPGVLPWVFRYLGPIRFETHLARLDESGEVARPFFWTARGSMTPHPRLSLALNRGAIFGGDPAPAVTLGNLLGDLFGRRRDAADDGFARTAFANQVASAEVRYRLLGGNWPTTLFLEWGMEDTSGAWKNVPGIIAGVQVAALPGIPGVSLGLQRAHFAPACCGNPRWYRHFQFEGGWADDGIPLGHPMGGHGDEWLLHGRADLRDARLRSSWRVFHRDRGFENLFAPDREGRSVGAAVQAHYRVTPRIDFLMEGDLERGLEGVDWTDVKGFFGVRTFF